MSAANQSVDGDLLLRVLRSIEDHALFHRMMEHQGINLNGSWWRGFEDMVFIAARRCEACPRAQFCQTWLEQERPQPAYPIFCPNSTFIEACRIMDPKAKPLLPTGPQEAL